MFVFHFKRNCATGHDGPKTQTGIETTSSQLSTSCRIICHDGPKTQTGIETIPPYHLLVPFLVVTTDRKPRPGLKQPRSGLLRSPHAGHDGPKTQTGIETNLHWS